MIANKLEKAVFEVDRLTKVPAFPSHGASDDGLTAASKARVGLMSN
jgi:hypothetical protein